YYLLSLYHLRTPILTRFPYTTLFRSSAKIVSNAREDFPEPDRPVKTTRLSLGISKCTFLRLCSRAPRMRRESLTPSMVNNKRNLAQTFELFVGYSTLCSGFGRCVHNGEWSLRLRTTPSLATVEHVRSYPGPGMWTGCACRTWTPRRVSPRCWAGSNMAGGR